MSIWPNRFCLARSPSLWTPANGLTKNVASPKRACLSWGLARTEPLVPRPTVATKAVLRANTAWPGRDLRRAWPFRQPKVCHGGPHAVQSPRLKSSCIYPSPLPFPTCEAPPAGHPTTVPEVQLEPCCPTRTRHESRPTRPPSLSNLGSLLPPPSHVVGCHNAALASGHTPPMLPGLPTTRTVDEPCGVFQRRQGRAWGPRPSHFQHPPRATDKHLQPRTPTTPQAQIFQPRWAGIPSDSPLSLLRPNELRTPQQSIRIGRTPRGGPRQQALQPTLRMPTHVHREPPRPFHHLAEPGIHRNPGVRLAHLGPPVHPDMDKPVRGKRPDRHSLTCAHAVSLPRRPPLVVQPRHPWDTLGVAPCDHIQPKPRGPCHMLTDGNLSPFGKAHRLLSTGCNRQNPHDPNPPQTHRLHNANKWSAKALKATGLTNATHGLTCEKNDLPLRPLKDAGVVKLVDTPDLGSGASAWGFESLHPHTFKKP